MLKGRLLVTELCTHGTTNTERNPLLWWASNYGANADLRLWMHVRQSTQAPRIMQGTSSSFYKHLNSHELHDIHGIRSNCYILISFLKMRLRFYALRYIYMNDYLAKTWSVEDEIQIRLHGVICVSPLNA
jgi:hypothetical protein